MSEQSSKELSTEQITKPPVTETPVKIKDPRRVAAGKALAARNKAAREAKKQSEPESSNGGVFNGVMQLAAAVGAGFTLYHGYQVVKPYLGNRDPREPFKKPVTTNVKPNEVKSIEME